MDPVEISVPEEEIIEPDEKEPIGNFENNESPMNVEGAKSRAEADSDDEDNLDAGDDEDAFHPTTPQNR